MNKIKAIIYDFDGVICDSVNVKTEAFGEMYAQYGKEIQKKVIDYHLSHGGISRFEKFKYCHKTFLGKELDDKQVKDMGGYFSSLVLQKVIDSPFIPGADLFVSRMVNNYMQFICTGTPEKEIKKILDKRKLTDYFTNIYGSPQTKKEIIQKIVVDYSITTNEMIFFGDALTDYDAALHENVRFVGVRSFHTSFPLGTNVINDFKDTQLQMIDL